MLWFFLIGALLPIIFFFLDRYFPKLRLQKVPTPTTPTTFITITWIVLIKTRSTSPLSSPPQRVFPPPRPRTIWPGDLSDCYSTGTSSAGSMHGGCGITTFSLRDLMQHWRLGVFLSSFVLFILGLAWSGLEIVLRRRRRMERGRR